jgi:hypothetical protein
MAKKNKTNGKTVKPVKVKTSIVVNRLAEQVRQLEERVEVLENSSENASEPTVASLSDELGISPKTLRGFLRDNFPRPASDLYKPWGTLTEEMVNKAKERYLT